LDYRYLNPRNLWGNPEDWDKSAKALGEKFIANFTNFTDNEEGKRLIPAGPNV
jgi:phosphoenolpyruvate carboxykinase (ATP)